METWTSVTDVTDAWIGEGAPEDYLKIATWIEKAEREIRYRVPDIVARIEAQAAEIPSRTDLIDTARDVVVAMVTRVFRNPEGIRSVSDTKGPFSTSTTYGGDAPGGLTLTDAEVSKLAGSRGGAFTIDLIPSTSPFYVGPPA
ncbi:hypothetical protein NS183_07780 [Microbacterium testaceum]|uniref:Gp19/Gp15/Gp42 family protein n=1 Tax=Microbacterium testaceum TaxID=2033 RepID=UPI0007346482|nr:Gp19/Gp15/Gp42 family protein [Microbacterium testaceum]KTS90677.1 hypothetical protein NS183_07780 [Microbacterium testaceum]